MSSQQNQNGEKYMVTSSRNNEKLESQIVEAYARVLYSYTSHIKQMKRLDSLQRKIKIFQIILSALSTVGFIGTLITNIVLLNIISGLLAFLLLAINLYFKEFDVLQEINDHRNASDELWLIKEKYLSLLTDFPYLTDKEIMLERDNLLNSTHCIYSKSRKTDSKAYKEAQEALKFNEEQYFSKNELNNMLPDHLRKSE